MRLLVLGAAGMLGHQLFRTLSGRFEIWGSFRGEAGGFERGNFIPQNEH